MQWLRFLIRACIDSGHRIRACVDSGGEQVHLVSFKNDFTSLCNQMTSYHQTDFKCAHQELSFQVLHDIQWSLVNPDAINPDASLSGRYFWWTNCIKIYMYQMWFIHPDASFIRTILLGTKVSGLTRLHCSSFDFKIWPWVHHFWPWR
jgi:hypothetical protein